MKAASRETGDLAALVLAAGRGARFGGGKLLATWRGGLLLHGALSTAAAAPVREIVLVVGAGAVEVADAAIAWAATQDGVSDRLRIVEAADWRLGLSASLKAGIAALPADVAGAYVFLADMPRVPSAVLAPLAAALRDGAAAAAPVHQGQLGNPVLVGRPLFPAVAELEGDRGARGLLERLGPTLARVQTADDGVVFDVDTRDVLAREVLAGNVLAGNVLDGDSLARV